MTLAAVAHAVVQLTAQQLLASLDQGTLLAGKRRDRRDGGDVKLATAVRAVEVSVGCVVVRTWMLCALSSDPFGISSEQ
jgi:hypothetical protein